MNVRTQAAEAIWRLELMSQASAMNLEPHVSSNDGDETAKLNPVGGKLPPGGVDKEGDRTPEFRQKSAEHFKARYRGCRSDRDFSLVLADALEAEASWKRTPLPSEPLLDDPQWKRWVADSTLPDAEIARRYSVSRQYVNRIRRQYRKAA